MKILQNWSISIRVWVIFSANSDELLKVISIMGREINFVQRNFNNIVLKRIKIFHEMMINWNLKTFICT